MRVLFTILFSLVCLSVQANDYSKFYALEDETDNYSNFVSITRPGYESPAVKPTAKKVTEKDFGYYQVSDQSQNFQTVPSGVPNTQSPSPPPDQPQILPMKPVDRQGYYTTRCPHCGYSFFISIPSPAPAPPPTPTPVPWFGSSGAQQATACGPGGCSPSASYSSGSSRGGYGIFGVRSRPGLFGRIRARRGGC